jgi:hypothetical protein
LVESFVVEEVGEEPLQPPRTNRMPIANHRIVS